MRGFFIYLIFQILLIHSLQEVTIEDFVESMAPNYYGESEFKD